MISFNELLNTRAFNRHLNDATLSVTSEAGHTLSLKLSKSETILEASFTGPFDPWLAATCAVVKDMSIHEARKLTRKDLEASFQNDQAFWDHLAEREETLWFMPTELIRVAIDAFEGREHLYQDASPIVCRCFNVREDEILKGIKTRAGMGCRTCLPQLTRLKNLSESRKSPHRRYYKELSYADWLILADEKLKTFQERAEWGLEVGGFKGKGIVITYTKSVSQKEEEAMALKLQDFCRAFLDSSLSFFLRRS